MGRTLLRAPLRSRDGGGSARRVRDVVIKSQATVGSLKFRPVFRRNSGAHVLQNTAPTRWLRKLQPSGGRNSRPRMAPVRPRNARRAGAFASRMRTDGSPSRRPRTV